MIRRTGTISGMEKRSVIAATRNKAKLAELSRIVGDIAGVLPLPEGLDGDPPEGDRSIEENAISKAVWWSERVPGIVIATDGGLEIPALGAMWNPAMTKRFAGSDANDLERANALLELAKRLSGNQRTIGWLEVVAVARGGALLGGFPGRGPAGILAVDVDPAEVGAGRGFWIPALWKCPEYGNRRLSSLTIEERNLRPDHWHEISAPLRRLLSS